MPLQKLNKEIRDNKVAPYYFFSGDEKYLLDKAVAMLTKHIVPAGAEEFCFDKLSLTENTIDDVLSSAYMLSMMSPKRLIIVKDAEKMKERDYKAFLKYIESPVATSCVIFISNKEKVDMRLKFFTRFKKKGQVLNFKPLYENKLPPFIMAEARSLHMKITSDAVNYLIRLIGNNLLELDAELRKIALSVGEKGLIELKDVKECCGDVRRNTVFELADSLGKKDLTGSLRILTKMLEHGEYPVAILGAIIRHFNNLFEIKERLEKREKNDAIAKALRIHPFFLKNYISQTRNIAKRDLKRVFESLLLTDIALKSRKLPDKIILEKLFFDLCL